MGSDKWDASQIPPSVAGAIAIVTGANSGIGFVAARELALHGAHVVLACRSEDKGLAAERKITVALNDSATPAAATGTAAATAATTKGTATFMKLDVSSLESVREFADKFKKEHDRLDLLINNAGIMAVPHALTVDGIESQFATNHLGHFALTARLFGHLRKSERGARIVNLASVMHWFARMKLDRVVTPESHYRAIEVYANTKLYNILFMKELDRRLHASGISNVMAVVCHPGYSNTNLVAAPSTKSNWFMRFWWGIFVRLPLGQPCEMGALPTLYAATMSDVAGGEYYGPDGFMSVRGHPQLEKPTNDSDSVECAKKLWDESEALAKLTFAIQ